MGRDPKAAVNRASPAPFFVFFLFAVSHRRDRWFAFVFLLLLLLLLLLLFFLLRCIFLTQWNKNKSAVESYRVSSDADGVVTPWGRDPSFGNRLFIEARLRLWFQLIDDFAFPFFLYLRFFFPPPPPKKNQDGVVTPGGRDPPLGHPFLSRSVFNSGSI